MLIEFTIKNYRSIKEAQTFSMVTSKGNELKNSNTFTEEASNTDLLRSAVIYGANAAGKSNFIRALMDMNAIVRNSASKSQEGDLLDIEPFLFNDSTLEGPTEFEAIFLNEGVKYQYGFSATKKKIIEEWLIAYPKGRAQRWFSRFFNEESRECEYKFSDNLLGKKSIWQNATRANALFLSTAVQLNSDQLKPVFNWFKGKLQLVSEGMGDNISRGFSILLCENKETKNQILNFLKYADLDIHDFNLEKQKFDPAILPKELPDALKEEITKDMEGKNFVEVKTIHKTQTGKLVSLDLSSESEGTQRLFALAGPWIDVLSNGYILVIDELNNSLHPKMVEYLIKLFHNDKTNPNNAQLIFTTHETSILSQDIFRRDQIWFSEKNQSQETSIYPLTDFSPRKGRENIELGYLSGRYGGVPFIKSLDEL